MAQSVTIKIEQFLIQGVSVGDVVRYGPAGAIWEVGSVVTVGTEANVELRPVDPHDVSFAAVVRDIAMPFRQG
jgi:hypothetical protein